MSLRGQEHGEGSNKKSIIRACKTANPVHSYLCRLRNFNRFICSSAWALLKQDRVTVQIARHLASGKYKDIIAALQLLFRDVTGDDIINP